MWYAQDAARNMTMCHGVGFTNTYAYDHARRMVFEAHAGADGVRSNYFVYDGLDIVAKVDDISGEVVYFARGLGIAPGVGDVLAETHINGSLTQTYLYVQNHRGDTVALLDENGAAVGGYEYDAWGRVIDAHFTFSGKHFAQEAGLYYYGYRWYDPVAKRWTQPDPQGLNEGLDLYRFCNNDPVNGVDAYGARWCPAGVGHAWIGLLEQAKYYSTISTGIGWLDHGLNTFSSSYIDLMGGKVAASFLCLGENWYDRYQHNVCDLGNSQWFAVLDVANLTVGDFVGYTALLEGSFGVDRSTLETITTEQRWVRGITGGVQLGISVVAGAELLHTVRAPGGLITPGEYFGSMTEEQAVKALTAKYGPPRPYPFKKVWFDRSTGRSFTIHNEIGHGSAHIDITIRPDYKYPKIGFKE